jgi:hypothetical protein
VTSGPASFRRVLVPVEHGGWAFLGEPIVLGLLVAFSPAGLLVAAAAMAAYLGRQPLKLWIGDRRKRRRYPRTVTAERALAACITLAALAVAGALLLSRGPLVLVLALAAPLVVLALALDLGRMSREAAAEVSAALALGGTASAAALAAGWAVAPALGLWAILAARTVPTILYVRARLRLDRGERAQVAGALTAHALGVGFATVLAVRHLAPWLGVGAIGLLALRAVFGLSALRPRLTTLQLGLSEVAIGLATVLAIAVGVKRGW